MRTTTKALSQDSLYADEIRKEGVLNENPERYTSTNPFGVQL
jgi:hypothetical protein